MGLTLLWTATGAIAAPRVSDLVIADVSDRSVSVIWVAGEGTRVMALGHAADGAVRSVDFHSSGRYVALAGEDGTARIWEVELE